tara:strand:- start:2567 stop:2767 length:201 start_codon:yes stop_codon:yes gene_type:complete
VANGKDPKTTGEHIIALYGHISGLKKTQDHMHKGLDDVRQKVNWFFVALVGGMGAIILTLVNLLSN